MMVVCGNPGCGVNCVLPFQMLMIQVDDDDDVDDWDDYKDSDCGIVMSDNGYDDDNNERMG